MATLAYPLLRTGALIAARGHACSVFTTAIPVRSPARIVSDWRFVAYPLLRTGAPVRFARDWRFFADTGGTITTNNRVLSKTSSAAPEAPVAGARVRLHRLADGYCAWQGISDAEGWYWPTGLEVSMAYYPVAIDLTRQYECVAAGPVVAVRAAP